MARKPAPKPAPKPPTGPGGNTDAITQPGDFTK